MLRRALAGRRRQACLGTKLGFVWDHNGKAIGLNGHPDYVRRACDASLRRLRTDVIDIYYLHRVDPKIPIEETVGAIAKLVQRRPCSVHRVPALQSEYSLWTRDPEKHVLPLCRELGIGFVKFSPLGSGFSRAS